MKIHEFKPSQESKDTYVQIYLKNEKELEDENIINEIKKYQVAKYKIAYFISGSKDYPPILKDIIFFEMEKEEDM